ncbi:hypothetical protein EYF80_009310 [Liparis tanakae]|uniref:Uncharacterized protein n=1 Tax=Liparis tanakae TaxID=230148 RepID=A0A4Z2IR08_9TELE|nr:hypothetical protein EYF80_009310 [Liparis tanakae]
MFSVSTEENEHKADSQELRAAAAFPLLCVSWEKSEWAESHSAVGFVQMDATPPHRVTQSGTLSPGAQMDPRVPQREALFSGPIPNERDHYPTCIAAAYEYRSEMHRPA